MSKTKPVDEWPGFAPSLHHRRVPTVATVSPKPTRPLAVPDDDPHEPATMTELMTALKEVILERDALRDQLRGGGGEPPSGRDPAHKREPVSKMIADGLREIGVLAATFCWLDPAVKGGGWSRDTIATVVGIFVLGVALFALGVVVERRRPED